MEEHFTQWRRQLAAKDAELRSLAVLNPERLEAFLEQNPGASHDDALRVMRAAEAGVGTSEP